MNHKELITRLRSGAVIELEQFAFGGVATFADEAADMIEAAIAERDEYQQAADKMAMKHKVERDALTQRVQELEDEEIKSQLYLEKATRKIETLRQQLAEVQALIEASRMQEPAAWITPHGEGFRIRFSKPVTEVPLGWDALYAAPVVADDVLKAAQDILRKEAVSNIKQEIRSALHFSIQVLENSKAKAVGGAND